MSSAAKSVCYPTAGLVSTRAHFLAGVCALAWAVFLAPEARTAPPPPAGTAPPPTNSGQVRAPFGFTRESADAFSEGKPPPAPTPAPKRPPPRVDDDSDEVPPLPATTAGRHHRRRRAAVQPAAADGTVPMSKAVPASKPATPAELIKPTKKAKPVTAAKPERKIKPKKTKVKRSHGPGFFSKVKGWWHTHIHTWGNPPPPPHQ